MMSRLDVIVFGATGFTGRKAVEETLRISREHPLTWGIAGRSKDKLKELLAAIGSRTGEGLSHICVVIAGVKDEQSIQDILKAIGEDLSQVRIVIADVKDEQSLRDMTSQCKVLANCCGPYRHYGEPVIKACVETGTHQVDVSGEPQFIETMQWRYDKQAREAGVFIISACGYDSVPNDMGVVFLQQNFGGVVNSVESYMNLEVPSEHRAAALLHGTTHYGTWESLVYSISNMKELRPLREKVFPLRIPRMKPVLKSRSTLHRHNGSWCLPFPGADASIVYRTQRHHCENKSVRPAQFKAYIKSPSLLAALMLMINAVLVYCMTATGFTRKLLLKFPRFFSMGQVSHSGPKEEVMNNTRFTFELYGEGWPESTNLTDAPVPPPNKKVVAKVCGVNPGYGATVTALMFCALTILREGHRMPGPGGVLTTGAAFAKTDLLKHLQKNNLTFEIVNNETKE